MADETKISKNREKKIAVVADLEEKLTKSVAIVFTDYKGLTHKQIEGLKKAIKPLKAEFVVAKNTLILRALDAKKIKLENENDLQGQTGTLFIYEDVVSPLKELAKLVKELGIPNVKFGIMEGSRISGEEVLKLSTLPTKEILLAQLVGGLKTPLFSLHRALNWNLQKLVMTLGAVAKGKPADAPVAPAEPKKEEEKEPPVVNEPEPETILDETVKEEMQEKPADPMQNPGETKPLENKEEVKTATGPEASGSEGGEN